MTRDDRTQVRKMRRATLDLRENISFLEQVVRVKTPMPKNYMHTYSLAFANHPDPDLELKPSDGRIDSNDAECGATPSEGGKCSKEKDTRGLIQGGYLQTRNKAGQS